MCPSPCSPAWGERGTVLSTFCHIPPRAPSPAGKTSRSFLSPGTLGTTKHQLWGWAEATVGCCSFTLRALWPRWVSAEAVGARAG